MTPKEHFEEFKSYLDLDGDTWMDGDEIWRKLYNAQQEIIRLINRQNPTYYVVSYSISLVAGTALYSLPLNARLGSKILFTEDVDDYLEILPAGSLVEKIDFDAPGLINLIRDRQFILQRGQVRIMPTPTASETIKAWFLPSFGNMIQGKPSAATSSTLSLFTDDDPDYTSNFGRPNKRNDYYNNMVLEILDGDGEGEFFEISDYTGGSSLSCSIASNSWTTTPDTDSEFCIQCPVIEDFHQMVPVRAALDGAVKNRNRLGDLRQLYREMKDDLLAWCADRQEAAAAETEPDYGEL